jgi:hypothetical protein
MVHLRQSCLTRALHGQPPALPECPMPHPERKSLSGCQGQKGLGLCLDSRHLAAAVMQNGRIVLSVCQTLVMSQRLSQGQRLLTVLHGLCRIAQAPQRQRRQAKAPHSRRHAMAEHQGLPPPDR